ncbi:MAG TPA: hypothetical protein VMB85_08590 [Bryobacteraceae bacterium]|nr:hypothetical protein [Bryobacteraceae bacterium]
MLGVLAAGLVTLPMIPQAKADLWNQRTTITFTQPVEVPGRVLGPGTYVFQLANSQSNRNIIQIFNRRQNHVLATEMTIPAYRATPRGHTVVTFEERAANSPAAVRDWFYPGMNYGHQFIYNR